MYYKSFILATTLVLCSIGNAVAAETPTAPELDGEQRLSKIDHISINDNLGSLAATNPTLATVIPNGVTVQDNPLVAKVSDRIDTESLTLPVDTEQAWLSGLELAPKSTVKLHEITVEDSVAVPTNLAVVNTNAEFTFPTVPLADSDPMQGYYTPQNNLLMGDGRVAQAPESTPPAKAERPISNSERKPADKKNYVGLTIGSVFSIPAYGINAKFEIIDNVSVRPFIQYAKVPNSILNLAEGGGNDISISGFLYGLSATYDFNIPGSPLAPYAGIGLANASGSYVDNSPRNNRNDSGSSFTSPVYLELGADYKLTDEVIVNVNYKVQDLGIFSFGAGYRF